MLLCCEPASALHRCQVEVRLPKLRCFYRLVHLVSQHIYIVLYSLVFVGHFECLQLQTAMYQFFHRHAHHLHGYIFIQPTLRFQAEARAPSATRLISDHACCRSPSVSTLHVAFTHSVSADVPLSDSRFMSPRVPSDRRQCVVSYAPRSTQDKEVYYHKSIDEHERYWTQVSKRIFVHKYGTWRS
jgi:hypothetical protein